MNATVEVLPGRLEYADKPFWHDKTKCLYYVNVYQSEIHKYDPEIREHTFAKVGDRPLAFVIPVVDFSDKFLVGYGNDIGAVTWDGVSHNVSQLKIIETVKAHPGRVSDGKVSPSGVLFVGTSEEGNSSAKMGHISRGNLFNFPDCARKELLSNIGVANGMAWDQEETTFYFIDSSEYRIEKYCWDKRNNELTRGCVIYEFKDDNLEGYPSGMTIDCDEFLWIGCFNGGQIIRLNPRIGRIVDKIQMPDSPRITSLTFGGRECNTLFVTTAATATATADHSSDAALQNSGRVFQITGIEVNGPLNAPFRLLF